MNYDTIDVDRSCGHKEIVMPEIVNKIHRMIVFALISNTKTSHFPLIIGYEEGRRRLFKKTFVRREYHNPERLNVINVSYIFKFFHFLKILSVITVYLEKDNDLWTLILFSI